MSVPLSKMIIMIITEPQLHARHCRGPRDPAVIDKSPTVSELTH